MGILGKRAFSDFYKKNIYFAVGVEACFKYKYLLNSVTSIFFPLPVWKVVYCWQCSVFVTIWIVLAGSCQLETGFSSYIIKIFCWLFLHCYVGSDGKGEDNGLTVELNWFQIPKKKTCWCTVDISILVSKKWRNQALFFPHFLVHSICMSLILGSSI